MENKKNKFKIVFGIGMMLIVLIGSAYAFYNYLKTMDAFTLTSDGINATFTEGNNEIDFSNAYPVSDEFAIQNLASLDYIDFTVSGNSVNSDETVKYEIYLTEKEGNDLNSDYVKLYLTDNNNNEIVSPVIYSGLVNTTYRNDSNNGKVIYETKTKGETRNYRLYAWIDSSFEDNSVSRNFSFYVNIYAYNDNIENMYKVTFDANGGVVDTESKYVNYHEMYGELPEPTRDGYTFMGWNGKNLINYNDITEVASTYGISVDINGNVFDTSANSDGRQWTDYNASNWKQILKSGDYILSIIFNKQCSNNSSGYNIFDSSGTSICDNCHVAYQGLNNLNNKEIKFTLSNEKEIGILIKNYDGIYRIQLEKGIESIEWEPYYITSNTKVVQNHDHTLKAIWEENE